MKPRARRGLAIAAGLSAVALATGLVLNAFRSNLVFFFSPTQVAAKEAPEGRSFRLGGLVQAGSLTRTGGDLTVRFLVTDLARTVPVVYTGLLPDLFSEGKGVVAQGRLGADGVFHAEQVLAKHDENYMPPEARQALADARPGRGAIQVAVNVDDSASTSAKTCGSADNRAGTDGRQTGGSAVIVELGHFALILALAFALVQAVLPLAGAARGRAAWVAIARPAAFGQLLFVALAYAALTQAFVSDDFSVRYVAEHSNTALPLVYRITAVWGGHEGSILLWVLILAGWTAAVAVFSRPLDAVTRGRILGVMGLISTGFLLFTLLTSNPFLRLLPAAADGQDLTPLLQDPGMVIHPPMLYMGYVGFVVAFAFAVAALLAGRLDTAWARWSRPWTLVAWSFLTCGIALGSFWAYYELGWGGWWFWDPVENASLMPWLAGTALLHSLAVTEKRGALRMWTALLAIITFSLSLLGTFIVRSGVLTSVHAFATDPTRGVFILGFLALVIGGSLLLFAWRAPRVAGAGAGYEPVSREAALLANNLLLVVACAAVMLGTLYPLVIDALGLGKLSVGPPYFNAVFVPLMAPAVFLMGVGPLLRWRQAGAVEVGLRLRWAGGVSLASALLAPVVVGGWTPMVGFGLLMAVWVAATTVTNLWQRLGEHPAGRRAGWAAQSGSYRGMLLAHAGVAVFIAGVTVVGGFAVEKDVRMAPGDTVEVAGTTVRFDGTGERQGSNHVAVRATLTLLDGEGRPTATLHPEKRVYTVSRSPMTETAIDRGFTRDIYLALGEPQGTNGAWSVRVYHKPLVNWIWAGCLLMAIGGLLAVLDKRYRTVRREATADPGRRSPMAPGVAAMPKPPALSAKAVG